MAARVKPGGCLARGNLRPVRLGEQLRLSGRGAFRRECAPGANPVSGLFQPKMSGKLYIRAMKVSLLVFLALAAGSFAQADAVPPQPVPAHKQISSQLPRLAVLDVELSGDLGGPGLASEHADRLNMASAKLRDELRRGGLFQLVGNTPAQELIATLKSQQLYLHDCNGCDLDVGRLLGVDQVLVSWVNRVSNLILTLTYEIHDVRTGEIVARKSYDFRGDNDTAWSHAIVYMVQDMKEQSKSPSSP